MTCFADFLVILVSVLDFLEKMEQPVNVRLTLSRKTHTLIKLYLFNQCHLRVLAHSVYCDEFWICINQLLCSNKQLAIYASLYICPKFTSLPYSSEAPYHHVWIRLNHDAKKLTKLQIRNINTSVCICKYEIYEDGFLFLSPTHYFRVASCADIISLCISNTPHFLCTPVVSLSTPMWGLP